MTEIGYYGYLATHVAPQRLLATAARRALRAARSALTTGPLDPGRDELLEGLRCRGPGEVAGRICAGAAAARADAPALASALGRYFPGEAERIARRAEAAAAGRLAIFGREVSVLRPGSGCDGPRDLAFDWQLDPFHGGRFAGWAPSSELPRAPGSDPKMAWAVGRGDHWVALACGAAADPRRADRYAEAFAASVLDFTARNPLGRGVQWACPMEAALRALNLTQAHALLAGHPALADPCFAVEAARLLVGTGRFVLARLEDDLAVPNNHLAADWVGLLACALALPAWPEAGRWRALAVAGLRREIIEQTLADGTSFEGSLPYHRLALEIFTAGGLLCRGAHIPLGWAYWRRLREMYRAARSLLFSDGTIPQIGDCDSGRVFAFRERAPLEGGYLLSLGAAVLADPALRIASGAAGAEEVLWLCGPSAVERLAQTRPGEPPRSASYRDGGFHLLRRGSLEAAISCGPNGQRGIGGHSHNDKLAFELRVAGRLAVCDSGTYCYTSDPGLRNAFRGTRAHATLTVDGAEQSPLPAGRLFALPDGALAEVLRVESAERLERLAGEHRGYARLGLIHRRELALLDAGLVILDHLLGSGEHHVEVRFPLPSAEARLRPLAPEERARARALLAEAFGSRAELEEQAVEIGPAPAPLALVAVAGPAPLRPALEHFQYSPGYGELREARTAVAAARVACPATFTTVILCGSLQERRRSS